MKRTILLSLLTVNLMFADAIKKPVNDGPYSPSILIEETAKNDMPNLLNNTNQKSIKCGNLSIKSRNIDESKNIEQVLKTNFPSTIWTIYRDTLINYNQTQNVVDYITKENFMELASSIVYGNLIILNYEINSLIDLNKYSEDSEQIQNLKSEYNRLIKTIQPSNSNWCNETISLEIKDFINSEITSRINEHK